MQLLATLYGSQAAKSLNAAELNQRKAVRAVILNDDSQVALLNVSKHSYHKLPGGGIEAGEDSVEALAREVKEELGCEAEVIAEIGRTDEYWDKYNEFQQSFCYLAKMIGAEAMPEFTEDELARGFQIVWAGSIEAAIELLERDIPNEYEGKLIQQRDLTFLRAAEKNIRA